MPEKLEWSRGLLIPLLVEKELLFKRGHDHLELSEEELSWVVACHKRFLVRKSVM